MSESPRALGANGGSSDNESASEVELECSICLAPAVHPVQLPCSHIFCFLCVKGSANRSKRCALCRQVIPPHYLFRPTLLKKEELCRDSSFDDGHQWYYEGNRGWWQYDERTSVELETQFKAKCDKLEVLIAGFLYVVDFENMIQYRRNDPSRRRRIKRDSSNIPIKGVAGLKISVPSSVEGNRRAGDGGLEVDRNQNQSGNLQSSRSLPSPLSSGRQSNVDDTIGGPLSTDRPPVSSHSDRQTTEDQDRFNASASAIHNAMTENVDEAQTDINRNRSEGTRLGAIGQGATEDCLAQSSVDALPTSGQEGRDRVSTSDGNTDSCDLQESQDGIGSPRHERHQTEGDTDEAAGADSSATSVTDTVRSQEQGGDSSTDVQSHRMQLRSRSGRSVKRQSPNL